MHNRDDYLLFTDVAFDGMVAIVSALGDDLANQHPDLPGANSPYQILNHCVGMLDLWVGHLIAGRELERDRDAEFTATGSVEPLLARASRARRRLREDLALADPAAPVRAESVTRDWMPVDRPLSQEAALLHVLEELCQHHGQMQLTRDILRNT